MKKFFEDAKIPNEKIERFSGIRHPVGIVGCAMGHISILKRAKAEGWKSVLILEDDMQWIDFENNYKKLEHLVGCQTWDVCMLGGLYMEATPPKVHIAYCTNAYIVQSHYYDTLLENFETGLRKKLEGKPRFFAENEQTMKRYYIHVDAKNQFNVDVYWFKLQLRDNWIGMMDPMCDQASTYSDIYGKVVVHQEFDKERLRNAVNEMKRLIATNQL